jgi:two-component system, chemotaxis family, protein-glutamate methylesterase/glutaminase
MTRIDLLVIGGSAGSLEPLLEILGSLGGEHAMPIAIAIHQSPAHRSVVPELLARASSRAVREADDKEPLQPRTIYVAPPNYHLLVERTGTLALSVDEPVNFSRPSIDVLFESAADAYGSRVAGLVLSGANQDGTAGLVRIHDAGGVALVQRADSAQYPEMPTAAAERVPAARIVAPSEVVAILVGLQDVRAESLP